MTCIKSNMNHGIMRIFLNIRVMYRRMLRSKLLKSNFFRVVCVASLALLTTVACFVHVFTIASTFYCLHWKTTMAFKRLCELYRDGLAVGDLCPDMCDGRGNVVVLSCYTSHLNKEIVLTARWRDRRVVIKSKYVDVDDFNPNLPRMDVDHPNNEVDLSNVMSAVRELARINYGHVLSRDFVLNVVSSSCRDHCANDTTSTDVDRRQRLADVRNMWTLFQQHEFLALKLFHHTHVFPAIVGTCGHFYSVEYVVPVSEFLHYDWTTRITAALGIVELLDDLESRFDEPLRACDLKLEHFGLTERRTVRILDADNVFLQSAVKSIVNPSNVCQSAFDCSLFDCKVSCDTEQHVCDRAINSNLQVVCERLFLPLSFWNSSVFVPHLLHSIPNGLRSKVTSLIEACIKSVEPFHYTPTALAREIRTFL